MASFESHRNFAQALLVGLALLSFCPLLADAQQQPSGFAVERFYPSAPGSGWFIMDDLDISGRLGGAISLTSGYARNPLVITGPDGKQKLAVVSEQAFWSIGAAITRDRFRGYIDLPTPLWVNISLLPRQSLWGRLPTPCRTLESDWTLACSETRAACFVSAPALNSSFPPAIAPITSATRDTALCFDFLLPAMPALSNTPANSESTFVRSMTLPFQEAQTGANFSTASAEGANLSCRMVGHLLPDPRSSVKPPFVLS
jgi:hypothetical protein